MYHELIIQPRISETDLMGHINNVAVASWCEHGRVQLMMQLQKASTETPPFILARVEIDYRAEMYFGHDIELKTWIENIGSSSIRFSQELWQREHCCASGRSVMVHIDEQTRHSAPLPHDLVKQMEFYLVPDHGNVI